MKEFNVRAFFIWLAVIVVSANMHMLLQGIDRHESILSILVSAGGVICGLFILTAWVEP